MRRLWVIVLALAIVGTSACVADVRLPWMTLVADGTEYDGLLISYCWTSFPAGICADGAPREPPVHAVRSGAPVAVQVRTRTDIRELVVTVADDWRPGAGQQMTIDPARAGLLRVGAGTHYIDVSARWPRGSGHFLFGLRVERT